MRIAVVIPLYNCAAYIGQTIASVKRQSISDWQAIIVNDGSTDDSRALAQAAMDGDQRFEIVDRPNGGLSIARNTGLGSITPAVNYVLFLDADDVLEPQALEILCNHLDRSVDSVAAYGLARFIDPRGNPLDDPGAMNFCRQRHGVIGKKLAHWPLADPTTFAVLAYRNCIWTAGQVAIRCDALRRAGLFDPAISSVADWDMWLRLSLVGQLDLIDQVTLSYRRHPHSMSRNFRVMRQGYMRLRQKLLAADLSPPQRRIARRGALLDHRRWIQDHLSSARAQVQSGHLFFAARELRGASRHLWQFITIWLAATFAQ